MRKKVVVLSLTKNEIVIRKIRKTKSKLSLSIILSSIFIVVGVIFLSSVNFGKQVAYVYNPVNSLYNDNSNVVFTGGVLSEKLDFRLPVVSARVENNNGEMLFTISNSIMISASESGVILECGANNQNEKYIKIKHSENIYSIIENVDIIGVSEFDIVKRGQDIATGKLGEKIKFRIYKDDSLITDIKIDQSKITWQN